MSTLVWTSGSRHTHVHAVPDCHGARCGKAGPMHQVELASLRNPVPCKRCFPAVPRLRVWHQRCQLCGHSRPTPCPHNGAVLALVPHQGRWVTLDGERVYDPDTMTWDRRWVWPENAHQYTLVDSALQQ